MACELPSLTGLLPADSQSLEAADYRPHAAHARSLELHRQGHPLLATVVGQQKRFRSAMIFLPSQVRAREELYRSEPGRFLVPG